MARQSEGRAGQAAGESTAKKSSPRKSTARSATSKRSAPARKRATKPAAKRSPVAGTAKRTRTATVTLPFVTAEFRVPQLHAPSMGLPHVSGQELTEAARAVGSRLPAREQLTHAAGLGAGVMVVLIERPVATVVAAARGFVPKRVRPGGADRARAARKSTT